MGKVYQALNRAEREREQAAALMGITGGERDSEGESDGSGFDFVDFSLGAPPAAEVARRSREQAEEVAARAEATRPARQAALDLTRLDPRLVTLSDSDPAAAECYNEMAIACMAAADAKPFKRLLIASAAHGEGRTSVTLNLARALSRAGKRVLVVDADLRRPSALRLLGLEADAGLIEAVRGQVTPGAAVLKVLPAGFAVLPARARAEASAEVLSSPALRGLLDTLEADYDFLLFDSPPLDAADTGLLARLADAALLVVRAGKTSSLQMARVLAPLANLEIIGVALNRADA